MRRGRKERNWRFIGGVGNLFLLSRNLKSDQGQERRFYGMSTFYTSMTTWIWIPVLMSIVRGVCTCDPSAAGDRVKRVTGSC